MEYQAIHIHINPLTREFSEILIALLDVYEFEGIHEKEEGIDAFIATDRFQLETLVEIESSLLALGCRMSWEKETIYEQNWNQIWENNFEPVFIGRHCVIRAPFHTEFNEFDYSITIEPKMAFGTGHHQTTRLMIEQMLQMDFKNRKVLDMGCGTGILGILASMMGASVVVSVDIDNRACQSTKENASVNRIINLTVIEGESQDIPASNFNIILANINRNILLEQMNAYARHTFQNGFLILSGILINDTHVVRQKAEEAEFKLLSSHSLDNWVVMLFKRN